MKQPGILKISLLFVLWITSCRSSSDLIATTEGRKKLPYSVAVLFSEELEKYRERWSFGIDPWLYKRGIVEPQYFSVGEGLAASLFKTVDSIFQTAKILDRSDPAVNSYNRILKFSIQRDKCGLTGSGGNLDINFKEISDDGIRSRSSRFDVSVVIEVYEKINVGPVNKKSITGSGIYRVDRKTVFYEGDVFSPTMMGLEKRKNRLEKAIADAIKDVNKKVTRVLTSDFLEQKRGKEVKPEKEQVELKIYFEFLSTFGEGYAFIKINLVPYVESLKFGIPGDSNQYSLEEFNIRLSEHYIIRRNRILIMNRSTGAQDSIKITWPVGFKRNSISINITKKLKKIGILQ